MRFWQDLMQFVFLQHAVLAGILASLACGPIGSFVVARRMSYAAGAIAHCVLGGMGAARYFQRVHGIQWMTPLFGAVAAALMAALIIAWVTRSGRQRQDTVLSAVWAIGMAVGISFITATPGYYEDLMSYLFGSILMVGTSELWQMFVLDVVVIVVLALFYDRFLLISFQPELALLRGIRRDVYHAAMLVLIALTVVLLTQVVGLIMVIALLTLPAATASLLQGRLWRIMIAATVISLFVTLGGLVISYEPELPAGATVIELAGITYLAVLAGKYLLNKRKQPV